MFISKFFSGDEYAVDFVSHQGKHKLVGVWKYVRSSDEKVWKDKVELLPYDETFSKLIYDAAVNWLNKIQHKTGPVHMELRYNGSEFFCVEINVSDTITPLLPSPPSVKFTKDPSPKFNLPYFLIY
jgi:hypothetical protein